MWVKREKERECAKICARRQGATVGSAEHCFSDANPSVRAESGTDADLPSRGADLMKQISTYAEVSEARKTSS